MSESEEEYDEFEEQLRLEKLEKERRERCSTIQHGATRTDPDGTVYEWDADRMAYFPKIDANFIAQYQMNYGSDQPESETKKSDGDKPATADSTTDWNTYFSYVMKYTAEHGKYPPEMSKSHIDYYNQLYNYYYPKTDDKTDGEKKGDKKVQKEDEKEGETKDEKAGEEEAGKGKNRDETEEMKTEGDKDVKKSSEDKDEKEDSQTGEKAAEAEESADEKAYREYYEYYQNYYSSGQKAEGAEDSAQREFDEWAYYNYYYGNAEEEEGEKDGDETKKDNKGEKKETEEGKKPQKRKHNEQGWFEVEREKNTNVYVSGLPDDITDDEYSKLMNKCGMIAYDPRTNKPKLKLYRDADGKPKGDGLCCYIKAESVGLALQMLDEYDVRGHKISVEVAKFELKGKFDPKKRKKLSNKEKKRIKEQQEKMFDWRPEKQRGYRPKHERIIVIKNAFDYQDFERDPKQIQTLREELRAQCTNFGTVKKVIVYDRHTEGVVTVAFTDVLEADLARESLHGRYFQRRQLNAEPWDGKTKFDVQETDEQKQARLKLWEKYLESGGEGDCPPGENPNAADAHSEDSKSESSKSEGSKSESAKSEDSKSGGSTTGGSKTEDSLTKGSRSEGSETEGFKSQSSKTEGSKSGGSKTEGSKTEGSKTEGSKTEDSNTEGSKTEEDMELSEASERPSVSGGGEDIDTDSTNMETDRKPRDLNDPDIERTTTRGVDSSMDVQL